MSLAGTLCTARLAPCSAGTSRAGTLHQHSTAACRGRLIIATSSVAPATSAASLTGSGSVGGWSRSLAGTALQRRPMSCSRQQGAPSRQVTRMGNKGSGGPFAPLVVVGRNALGQKKFNQLRGKAISLHSQVIKDFGKYIGAETKLVQGLIRTAKKNGEKLGFLA